MSDPTNAPMEDQTNGAADPPVVPPTRPFPDLPDEPTPLPIPGDPPGRPGDSRDTPPA